MFILDNIGPLRGQLMPKVFMSFADTPPGGDPPPADPPVADPPKDPPVTKDPPAPVVNTDTGNKGWKAGLGEDLSNAPLIKGFEDTPEGLKKAVESHVNLEKLLGHEKVPLPKGPDDIDGIARFNKALGIPDKVEGYNLPDVQMQGDMAKLTFSKEAFAKVALEQHLTPSQAEGLWKTYTDMSAGIYHTHLKAAQDKLNENINVLRNAWGDAYAGKVELGDMVIAKFADDKEMGDFLTAALSKDPAGMKFLAKIGQEFSENKVGEFQYKRHGITTEEAKTEIDKIKGDMKHPYNNSDASQKEHDAAVEHMNRLISISLGKKSA